MSKGSDNSHGIFNTKGPRLSSCLHHYYGYFYPTTCRGKNGRTASFVADTLYVVLRKKRSIYMYIYICQHKNAPSFFLHSGHSLYTRTPLRLEHLTKRLRSQHAFFYPLSACTTITTTTTTITLSLPSKVRAIKDCLSTEHTLPSSFFGYHYYYYDYYYYYYYDYYYYYYSTFGI